LTQGTPAEAVGTLGLGTENIISTIYQPLGIGHISRLPAQPVKYFTAPSQFLGNPGSIRPSEGAGH
jgi:hypothetical protein